MNVTPLTLSLVAPNSPVLYRMAKPVTSIDDQVMPYVEDMLALMHDSHGVGLAAPQVGLPFRFFVTDIEGLRVVVNPAVISTFGFRENQYEGCLTWPGRRAYVSRPTGIVFAWTSLCGVQKFSHLTGYEARVIQHELDHLNGITLFFESDPVMTED